jgi:general nucleoside transport system permease protein
MTTEAAAARRGLPVQVYVRRILLSLAAPALALVIALAVSSIALGISGHNPLSTFQTMVTFGTTTESLISMVDRALPYFLAGLAVAIGFRMALFNIGVEGQYLLAALIAAGVGTRVHLWAPLHVTLIILIAVVVGSLWAGVAGVLKVTRGVSEVISTIMLNYIATGLSAFLLTRYFVAKGTSSNLSSTTPTLPHSAWFPSLNRPLEAMGLSVPPSINLYGFLVVAVVVGIGFHLVVQRTRFGFDLRASGLNPFAAQASGVSPRAMVMRTMLLSGALAGLVGMPELLSNAHAYSNEFPTGIGFTGIAVALLGRNNPIGIAIGALLFGFMERSALVLDLNGIPKEIVTIMQGTIVLAVVVAYEVVRRISVAQAERAVRRAIDETEPFPPEPASLAGEARA